MGLEPALSGGTWTLFAPTNNAFLELPPSYVEEITQDEAKLRELLLFHTVPNQVITESALPCIAGENLITMSNDHDSRTRCVDFVPTYQKGIGNPDDDDKPKFVGFNFEACNGVMHKLDGVMLYEDISNRV